jgi:hypothetical protein
MSNYFEFGPTVNLLELPEEQAKQILGEPVYQYLKETRGSWFKGSFKVSSINRATQTITLVWKDDE